MASIKGGLVAFAYKVKWQYRRRLGNMRILSVSAAALLAVYVSTASAPCIGHELDGTHAGWGYMDSMRVHLTLGAVKTATAVDGVDAPLYLADAPRNNLSGAYLVGADLWGRSPRGRRPERGESTLGHTDPSQSE